MLPSPSSSPRPTFVNLTNVYVQDTRTPTRERTISSLPTPPEDTKLKRCFDGTDGRVKKRPKLALEPQQDEEDSDVDMDDEVPEKSRRAGVHTVFGIMNAIGQGRPGRRRLPICKSLVSLSSSHLTHSSVPTRPILQTFVSSHKSDVYKCHSIEDNSFMTLPYACSFSHS
jgi:denticleless